MSIPAAYLPTRYPVGIEPTRKRPQPEVRFRPLLASALGAYCPVARLIARCADSSLATVSIGGPTVPGIGSPGLPEQW